MKTEPLNQGKNAYLSKANCDCLKGIFAVFILLHHLYQHSGLLKGTLPGLVLQSLGFLSVAVFFFLSGYGLMLSYCRGGRKYVKDMPRNRILPFYCIIIFLVAIYELIYIYIYIYISTDSPFNWEYLIGSLTFGKTIIANGWYLQVQLLLYILFFLVFIVIRQSVVKQLLALLSGCVAYICVLALMGFSSIWYESVLAFVLGAVWYVLRDKIDGVLRNKKRWLLLLITSFLLFCVLLIGAIFVTASYINVIMKSLSALTFVIFVLITVYRVRINFAITRFLGKYSLEIYVLQGIFLMNYRGDFINIQSPYLYVALVVVSTFASALILHPIIKLIYHVWRKK